MIQASSTHGFIKIEAASIEHKQEICCWSKYNEVYLTVLLRLVWYEGWERFVDPPPHSSEAPTPLLIMKDLKGDARKWWEDQFGFSAKMLGEIPENFKEKEQMN